MKSKDTKKTKFILYYTFSFILFFSLQSIGQSVKSDKKIILSIAENIISNTTCDFYNLETKATYKKVDENNFSDKLRVKSPYNTWCYWNGVLNIAMHDMSEYFNDEKYAQQAQKNYEFSFDNISIFEKNYTKELNKWRYPFALNFLMEELDYCGAMGAGLIEVYKERKRADFKAYIDKVAIHILQKQERLNDGTLVRTTPYEMTLWADDLYMSIAFLARMGDLSGEQKYFDDAAKQVINFTKYLYNPTSGLYYHCWYSDLQENNVAYWGRCNGWVMLAQAELLQFLPQDHPQREELLSIFKQQVIGNARYQSESGLWHQVLDRNDSYLETSCTAMFTYSIAKAVNMGWIDKRYSSIATQGWEGIKSNVRADGQVENICIGTGIGNDIGYYYKRPVLLNDIHGLGAVLMAGVEVLKMN